MPIGTAPATTNRARHPNSGSIRIARRPAIAAPSGTHTIVKVTANARCRLGTNSAASAAALGKAPPRPSPAMNLVIRGW